MKEIVVDMIIALVCIAIAYPVYNSFMAGIGEYAETVLAEEAK